MCRTLTLWDTKFRFCEGKTWRFNKNTKKWTRCDNLKINSTGYIVIDLTNKKRKKYKFSLHRLTYKAYYPKWDIMDISMDNFIDHIDGNKLNNNIQNLRVVSHQENQFNTKAKGYYFVNERNKWRSYIRFNDKQISLGYYDTEEEAREARLKAKAKYHTIYYR